ncbi:5'-3' exoribonuclease 1 [Chionoecetes opilio]|uniref:5'-3' exoribonuclease 1 n=1 Tax=Chionoecetes opilio TaxID=41210 RepID=A0A8J5CVH6_CHIOP|nr:5'-3' exoribonuclease 1 [Chionoecetes opilio]
MGVPKFYRWISERYPCLSEVVKEYQIPEFDNLYLDMNGIIHICSHPNDNDPHFRITEEKMFKDIFHYIEVLFRLVQPRKVFFMAVDGVAPRAKMNQQRSRRFRSAKEAVNAEKKAKERGEKLPTEERFDSNCITPGTEFMDRLDTQMRYFVTSKVSQDKMWQDCKVIYSGHQTPGEGEHKIMEYIRFVKSGPDHDPNTRHCLYGLDADLIILGLTSHEPHFSLLREEVRFGGKKDNCRTPTPEETTFHLLHLSLMREYVNYEFYDLRCALPFPYDLESIIDDWVLMGFLVGNDFIPHLPHLHINKEALPTLYMTYKAVLPSLDGYLNEGGKLHLHRFEKFMMKLTDFEMENFQEVYADLKYFNSKRLAKGEAFKANKGEDESKVNGALQGSLEEEEDEGKVKTKIVYEHIGYTPDPAFLEDDGDSSSSEGDGTLKEEFRLHKRDYYMTKLLIKKVNKAALLNQATHYVRAIQWILNYYYNGICSWSWYYPFHYAPFISDVRDFAHMQMGFEMGRPFLPYQQLLGVLPPLSKKHISTAYWGLMTNEDSPLVEFYPDAFVTDLNGKQQDWEAVVLIPFIDEKRLLEAMETCESRLTKEETERNSHGPMYIYTHTHQNLGDYHAPNYFPVIHMNHAQVERVWREMWELPPDKIKKGLCPDVKLEIYFAGFPTLKHVDHKFHIAKEAVKVFQQNSRGENYILDITEKDTPDLQDVANQLLGREVFVSWPHLQEAKVEAVSDSRERLVLGGTQEVQRHAVEHTLKEEFSLSRSFLMTHYHDRWGVNLGHTPILVYAAPMTGRKYIPGPEGKMTLEKTWSKVVQPYALQTLVKDISVYNPGYKMHLTPQEYFPPRTKVFMLGQPHYGSMGEVIEIDPAHNGRIRLAMTVLQEPDLQVVSRRQNQLEDRYMTGYNAAQRLGISSHLLSRLTGTIFLAPPGSLEEMEMRNKLNIGLNLKNNKKNEEVNGYSRKVKEPGVEKTTWLYSDKAVEAMIEYHTQFPELFEHLAVNIGQRDIFHQDEVFGEDHKAKVVQLTEWLKTSAFAKAERQPCGTQALSEATVACLADQVDKAAAVRAKIVKMQVRPFLLFKPNPLQGSTPPDHTVTHQMFDRVVNVRDGFSVPLGARGTIVGIQPAEKQADILYDILFDEAFPGALTLRGPRSALRCYSLHWAALVNISHGARCHNNQAPPPTNVYQRWQQQQQPQYQQQQKQPPQRHQQPPQPQPLMNTVLVDPGVPLRAGGRVAPHNTPGSRVSGNSNTHTPEPASAQPPDPHQLPCPASLRIAPPQGKGGAGEDMTLSQSQSPTRLQGKIVPLQSASDVECVVHGTYYSTWNQILRQGLARPSPHSLIPCYPFVPPHTGGPRAYQLYIFIDVQLAMSDGIQFFLAGDRQVLCAGDASGCLMPKYFSRVVDSETRTIIYPMQHGSGMNGPAVKNRSVVGGAGRGGLVSSNLPNPQQSEVIHMYKNIWSQMQRLDIDNVSLRPGQMENVSLRPGQMENVSLRPGQMDNVSLRPGNPQNPFSCVQPPQNRSSLGRVEVSVDDIFRGATNQPQHISQPPPQPLQHPGQTHPQTQTQTQQPQGEPDIMSLLSAAQQSFALSASSSPTTTTPHKNGSPAKSAFVPTQVIRNQTPRKPKLNGQGHTHTHSGEGGAGSHSYPHQQPQQPQQRKENQNNSQQQQKQQGSEGTARPKRQVRNRLAVRFDQMPNKD